MGVALAACALLVLIAVTRSGPARRAKEAVASVDPASPIQAVAPPSDALPSRVTQAQFPAVSVAAPAAPSDRPVALDEAQLMDDLRHARTSVSAIRLAREGNRLFPDSDFAPERASILIHALADNEQRSEARGEAEYMVNHYPDSEWVREIERFTGAHRHRNARLNDAGALEFN